MADNLSTDDFNDFILEKEEEMKKYTEGNPTYKFNKRNL